MRKALLPLLFFFNLAANSQVATNYCIVAEFFPKDANLYGYPVSNKSFVRAHSFVTIDEINNDDIVFYLHSELMIDSIVVNNDRLEYRSEKVLFTRSYNLTALKISLNDPRIIENSEIGIYYSGFFNPSRARSPSDYMRIRLDEGVFLRSYGYSLWFPIFQGSIDNHASSNFQSVTIKLPSNFRCVVAGAMVSECTNDNTYICEWKPGLESIRNIQCTAQRYRVERMNNIHIYYLSDKTKALKILAFTEELKNLFESNLKQLENQPALYILEMPEYGDISSANIVGLSHETFNDFENDHYSKFTIAHELVHPYVQMDVSADNPFYALVIEGFPSFFQVYAMHRIDSTFDAKKTMLFVEKNYLQKKETGTNNRGMQLPIEKPILEIKASEIGLYKDSFILNDRVWLFFYDLWTEMGEEQFDAFLKELFSLQQIDYNAFETLVTKFIANYGIKLDLWLNSTDFQENIKIK